MSADKSEFTLDLDSFELGDMIEALDDWEHRYERELNYVKEFLDGAFLPEDAPEEAKKWFEEMTKRFKRRKFELESKSPDRKEKATIMKTKLILLKRRQAKKVADQLGGEGEERPPSGRTRHPELD